MAGGTLTIGMQTAVAEEQLVREAQAFSDEAWQAIFDASYPKMLDYCFLRTGNRAVAEDLASAVFLEAVRGIKRFRFRGAPLTAWLYRIAHNVTVDYLRRNARQQMLPLEAAQAATGMAVPHEAPEIEARHDLERAMRQLTDDQQQVLVLRFFHDLSVQETSAAMNRHSVAVRVLQHRALASLRRVMTREGEEQ